MYAVALYCNLLLLCLQIGGKGCFAAAAETPCGLLLVFVCELDAAGGGNFKAAFLKFVGQFFNVLLFCVAQTAFTFAGCLALYGRAFSACNVCGRDYEQKQYGQNPFHYSAKIHIIYENATEFFLKRRYKFDK